MVVACDIDGTLLNYGGGAPVVNVGLLRTLRGLGVGEIGIATNQGGIPWAVTQARNGTAITFPTADQFADRFVRLAFVLGDFGIRVAALRICVFHPNVPPWAVDAAARQLRAVLADVGPEDWHVYTRPGMRKPAGGMLRTFVWSNGTYYGDSDEDRDAAAAAGWSFVPVPRFQG